MGGGRPVGEGDVGARQQEPKEIETGAPTSDDDCTAVVFPVGAAVVEGQVIGGLSLSL